MKTSATGEVYKNPFQRRINFNIANRKMLGTQVIILALAPFSREKEEVRRRVAII